jgi:RNA polymerase sigma-70 factor (ECF subfamily)
MMIIDRARLDRAHCKREQFEQEALPQLDRLYSYAVQFADDRSQAEDWVQDAFLKAYRGWHTYRPGSNIRAWLLTILRNTIISHRRRTRRLEPVDFTNAERYSFYEQLQEADPEGRFLAGLVSDQVVAALTRLPEKQREAVVLSDMEGLSYAETAEVLEVPVGTVKSRLFRGRRTLQAELYEYAALTLGNSGKGRPQRG